MKNQNNLIADKMTSGISSEELQPNKNKYYSSVITHKLKGKTIHIPSFHLSDKQKKFFREFYKESHFEIQKQSEVNDNIVLFILAIIGIGILAVSVM
jgi:hypothetical protein